MFTASVEVSSLAEQPKVEEALAIMARDDPSLLLSNDEDTGG